MTSHRTYPLRILALLCVGIVPSLAFAEPFIQGSAINVPNNQTLTLDLPPDGVFNCSTVAVGCGAILNFKGNALNTPVSLLATGKITINGSVFVSGGVGSGSLAGKGGPGGFPGGMGGITGGHEDGGDGAGPGGGKVRQGMFGGAFAYPAKDNTNVYGNGLLLPMIGGSGGAGRNAAATGFGGGGGGGAILIASETEIEISRCDSRASGIYAQGGRGGGDYYGGGGSGGAIRLVAPLVYGDARLDTEGGLGGYGSGGGGNYPGTGSNGRIRIDCQDDYRYRSLQVVGSFSRGTDTNLFRPNAPALDVTFAAGQVIPPGTVDAVKVSLPFGSSTNQSVRLSARNFTGPIPVRIVVTPDTGSSLTYDGEIANTGNPSEASFNVVIPEGTISRIDAWSR